MSIAKAGIYRREPRRPRRACLRCNAVLRRGNGGSLCGPCEDAGWTIRAGEGGKAVVIRSRSG